MLDLSSIAREFRLPFTANRLAIQVTADSRIVLWGDDRFALTTSSRPLAWKLSREGLGRVEYITAGGGTLSFWPRQLPRVLVVTRMWQESEPSAMQRAG